MTIKERKALNELTVEDYRKALREIQGHLAACVGGLIMLAGYLASDLSLDSDNTTCVLSSAEDVVRSASESVKKALDCTYALL
ncbi:MAG: hypothetical protein A4E57_00370 [Syntrophorhabdaceae bacterium PtaU1.Bin034]|jgi:hypothetical protein|nr:MAG: hypothetical protein A4E57_00370 [Syntrophorhabdaceae bacterium PtaU1.Bin034]